MKSKIRKLVCLACMLAMAMVAYAEGNESGWTVNPYDYQYQMSIYARLVIEDNDVTADNNYEVAAFVGDECRGVATIQSQGGYTWLWMFVRSNETSGEKISFKVYDKTTGKEKRIAETVDFVSDGQIGIASSPTTFTLAKYTLGDVNDDGKINSKDLMLVIKKILKQDLPNGTIVDAMDMNNDGKYNSKDLQLIINIILKK